MVRVQRNCPTREEPPWARPFGFEEARGGFIPLLRGANGDLPFEPGSTPGGGEAMSEWDSAFTQEAIRRRRAHGKQLSTTGITELKVAMSFQRFNEQRQKRDEAVGTHVVGCIPDEHHRLLNVAFIAAWTRRWRL